MQHIISIIIPISVHAVHANEREKDFNVVIKFFFDYICWQNMHVILQFINTIYLGQTYSALHTDSNERM